MADIISLDQLPPELRAIIEKFTGEQNALTPVRRKLQLDDLREPADPKKRLHRPSFFFEYGPDVKPYKHQEYPKVKWHQNGTDTLVLTQAAEEALGPEWGDSPANAPADAFQSVKDAMMLLTDEEKALIVGAHRKARMDAVLKALDGLTEGELDAVLGENRPLKRKPGRPKKVG